MIAKSLLLRASSRDRTNDLLITSQLLYQLSYGGLFYLLTPFVIPLSWCKSRAKLYTAQVFLKIFLNFFLIII